MDAILQYPDASWNLDNHTNQLVPFFFKGAGAGVLSDLADQRDPIRGYYRDNTEMAQWLLSTAWVKGNDPTPTPKPSVSPKPSEKPEPSIKPSPTTKPGKPGLPKTGV